MKKILILLLLCSCSVVRPIREEIVIHHRDSISYHDSTIYHHIPVEVIKTITLPGDTSHLETSVAVSDAWTDTLGLHHTIKNKDTIPVQIKWKERIQYRDSVITQYKEVPYEVIKEVKPKSYYFLLGGLLMFIVYIVWKIIKYFK